MRARSTSWASVEGTGPGGGCGVSGMGVVCAVCWAFCCARWLFVFGRGFEGCAELAVVLLLMLLWRGSFVLSLSVGILESGYGLICASVWFDQV